MTYTSFTSFIKSIVITFMVAILFMVGTHTAAAQQQSTAELQAIINNLLEQVRVLQERLNNQIQGGITVGDTVTPTATINVRTSPNGVWQGVQREGAMGTVIAGPVQAGSHTWYQVRWSDITGWSAGSWLRRNEAVIGVRELDLTITNEPAGSNTAVARFTLGSPCSPYTIDWGDGNRTVEEGPPAGLNCSDVEVPAEVTHRYSRPGTYTVFVDSSLARGRATVTVGQSSSGSGPYDLAVTNEPAGSNTAVARFTLGSPCSPYTIDWGDGNAVAREGRNDLSCRLPVADSVEESHRYSRSGTYTVVVSSGASTERATVTVGQPSSRPLDLRVTNEPAGSNRAVIRYTLPSPCYAAEIDFGDGVRIPTPSPGPRRPNCNGRSEVVETEHTFRNAGTHTITVTLINMWEANQPRYVASRMVTVGEGPREFTTSMDIRQEADSRRVHVEFLLPERDTSWSVRWGNGTVTSGRGTLKSRQCQSNGVCGYPQTASYPYQRSATYRISLWFGELSEEKQIEIQEFTVTDNPHSTFRNDIYISFGDRNDPNIFSRRDIELTPAELIALVEREGSVSSIITLSSPEYERFNERNDNSIESDEELRQIVWAIQKEFLSHINQLIGPMSQVPDDIRLFTFSPQLSMNANVDDIRNILTSPSVVAIHENSFVDLAQPGI